MIRKVSVKQTCMVSNLEIYSLDVEDGFLMYGHLRGYIAQPGWEVFFNIEEFRTGRLLSDLFLFELKKLQYKV